MPVKFSLNQSDHQLWILCHQCYNLIAKCEEHAFAHGNLTPQYLMVLMVVKSIEPPVTPTVVANWLDRSTNSISMIVDRMSRDGLIERKRDVKDRRSLRLVITKKGEEAFMQTLRPAGELIMYVLSGLTSKEKQTLTALLEKIREKSYQYLEPGVDMEEVKLKDNFADFMTEMKPHQ